MRIMSLQQTELLAMNATWTPESAKGAPWSANPRESTTLRFIPRMDQLSMGLPHFSAAVKTQTDRDARSNASGKGSWADRTCKLCVANVGNGERPHLYGSEVTETADCS